MRESDDRFEVYDCCDPEEERWEVIDHHRSDSLGLYPMCICESADDAELICQLLNNATKLTGHQILLVEAG